MPQAVYAHAGTDQPLVRLTGTTNLPTATARHYHQDGLGSVVASSGPVAATSQNAAREAGASVAQSGVTTLYTIGGVASSTAAAVNGDKKASAGLWCVNSGASLELSFAGPRTIDSVVLTSHSGQTNAIEPAEGMQYPAGGSNLDTAAYSLQYWTGSAWAAVQGGTASGNLSVVRRISFAPVTTTKLKITLSDNASNNYSPSDGLVTLAEVEAWTAPALTAATQRFDAYGMPLAQTAAIPAYGYTGREPDATGLVYYRARYYDPSLGRFISRDPIGLAGGINRYGYVGGNPVNFNDPSGLLPNKISNGATQAVNYFGSQIDSFINDPVAHIERNLNNQFDTMARAMLGDREALDQSINGMVGFGTITRVTGSIARAATKAESVAARGATTSFYRYVSEGEAAAIRRTGQIPNVDQFGNPKTVYFTERIYETAGRAKTFNQLPSKPAFRIEIDPSNVPNRSPFTRIEPSANPQWGSAGGVEATTLDTIPVDPSTLIRLRGAP